MPPSATTISAARRRTHRWSVRAHLAVIFVTAVVLAAAALGYGYAWSADRARDDAIAAMRAQAQIGAREIADTLALGLEQVDEVAAQPGLAAAFATPEGCRLVVSGSEAFAVAHLAVVSPAGQVGCSSRPGLAAVDTRPYQGADWLRESLAARDVVVRWPADDAVADEPAIVAARSFGAGTVALLLGSRTVADTLAASQALPADAGIVVVDRETGRVVSSSDPGLAAPGSTAFAGRPATGQWDGADHEPRLIASADVEAVPWRVHAALDRASVTASARGTLERQALTAAVALLALLAALVLLERRVAGPLAALTRAAVRARDDAGTARVPEAGTAELATLARAFNAMLDIRAGQEARLAHGASHDRLTGLPNTEAFRAAVDAALETGPRPDLVVLCVGLDRFQAVSDGIGPDGAERLLVEVAARLRATVRPGDVLARGDGERFFVACEGLGAHGAVELAERLHLAVEEPMGWPTTGVALQVSTGIAVAAAGTSGTHERHERHERHGRHERGRRRGPRAPLGHRDGGRAGPRTDLVDLRRLHARPGGAPAADRAGAAGGAGR